MNQNIKPPGIFTKVMSFTYDAFLVVALWFLMGFIALIIYRFLFSEDDYSNTLLGPIVIILTTTIYYTYFWSYGRKTLAMSTWSHELQSDNNYKITYKTAFQRLVLNIVFNLVGLIWMLFDKDKKTLTDRILGLRTVKRKRSS